jgi:hypothetical protein
MKVALKLAALVTALTVTLVAIIWLKQGHMDAFWTSLGFQTGDRLSWCSERVRSVYHFQSGDKLLEKNGKWIWGFENGDEKVLDYLRVEKWFARYCQVPFQEVGPEQKAKLQKTEPLFEVQFIDSNRLTIFTIPEIETGYSIGNRPFQSETLRNGLQEFLAFGGKMQ